MDLLTLKYIYSLFGPKKKHFIYISPDIFGVIDFISIPITGWK